MFPASRWTWPICASTTLGYLNGLLIPDAWTGWAGDLASCMGNVKTVMEWNPGADLAAVCEALVGQGDDYRSHPGIRNLVLGKEQGGVWKTIGNSCNRDDLCCDGDVSTSRTSSSKVGVVTPIYYLV